MIKNIIFDLSEVIYYGYHGEVEKTIEERFNIPSEEFLKRKQETIEYFLDTMRGYHTEEEYFSYLLDKTNWNIHVNDLKTVIRENISRQVGNTIEIINKLKGKYKLILLSDYVREWKDYILENKPELSVFDYKYFSFQYKMLKKDEGIFKYIINDLQIRPEETIFIDDYENYTQKAQQNGIKGITFKSSKQLESDFKELKIL